MTCDSGPALHIQPSSSNHSKSTDVSHTCPALEKDHGIPNFKIGVAAFGQLRISLPSESMQASPSVKAALKDRSHDCSPHDTGTAADLTAEFRDLVQPPSRSHSQDCGVLIMDADVCAADQIAISSSSAQQPAQLEAGCGAAGVAVSAFIASPLHQTRHLPLSHSISTVTQGVTVPAVMNMDSTAAAVDRLRARSAGSISAAVAARKRAGVAAAALIPFGTAASGAQDAADTGVDQGNKELLRPVLKGPVFCAQSPMLESTNDMLRAARGESVAKGTGRHAAALDVYNGVLGCVCVC